MRVLVVSATWPVLLDHIPVGCVYVLCSRHSVVWIIHPSLTFALRLFIIVELEVGYQVMNRVDLLTIELDGHRVRHATQVQVCRLG